MGVAGPENQRRCGPALRAADDASLCAGCGPGLEARERAQSVHGQRDRTMSFAAGEFHTVSLAQMAIFPCAQFVAEAFGPSQRWPCLPGVRFWPGPQTFL